MPEISRFYGILIKMFSKEHNPPHLHAIYGNFKASFSLQSAQIIEGEFPPQKAALVTAWIILHQEQLLKNWNGLLKGSNAEKIEPLR